MRAQKQTAPHKNGSPKKGRRTEGALPVWKEHLASYKDIVLLRFDSIKELERAIELLWTDDLRCLPHDTPDGRSIAIPAEAADYFTRAGLKFSAKKMKSISDLTPDEIEKLRR